MSIWFSEVCDLRSAWELSGERERSSCETDTQEILSSVTGGAFD